MELDSYKIIKEKNSFHSFSTWKSQNGGEFMKLVFWNNHNIAGITNYENMNLSLKFLTIWQNFRKCPCSAWTLSSLYSLVTQLLTYNSKLLPGAAIAPSLPMIFKLHSFYCQLYLGLLFWNYYLGTQAIVKCLIGKLTTLTLNLPVLYFSE